MSKPSQSQVLDVLLGWGRAHPEVQAIVLTSSRARADLTVDALSDYDVIVAVTSPPRWRDWDWVTCYGEPMARWGATDEVHGHETIFRGVVYRDGVKIDWTIWPTELLAAVTQRGLPDVLDVGYRVLLDKQGDTRQWPAASYRAHVPTPPSPLQYTMLVEEFWWSATYVAKAMWRGDHMFARHLLETDLRMSTLVTMLEWLIEFEHDWSHRPGVLGRGIERQLPPEVVSRLDETYSGAQPQDVWKALDTTADLFADVARDVAARLGYEYPEAVQRRTLDYLAEIRALPAPA
jgi:aminoglycoside 6-adenylyltransferase